MDPSAAYWRTNSRTVMKKKINKCSEGNSINSEISSQLSKALMTLGGISTRKETKSSGGVTRPCQVSSTGTWDELRRIVPALIEMDVRCHLVCIVTTDFSREISRTCLAVYWKMCHVLFSLFQDGMLQETIQRVLFVWNRWIRKQAHVFCNWSEKSSSTS